VRPGRTADHSPPSSAAVMEEWSYNSTHPLGHTGPVTGTLYLFLLCRLTKDVNAVSMFIATKCNNFQLKFFSELYTNKTAHYSPVSER